MFLYSPCFPLSTLWFPYFTLCFPLSTSPSGKRWAARRRTQMAQDVDSYLETIPLPDIAGPDGRHGRRESDGSPPPRKKKKKERRQ